MKTDRFICIILAVGIFLTISAMPAAMADADYEIKVILDGVELSFDVPPQLVNDRTMVPMRKIFEELGASVQWFEEEQKIFAQKGTKSMWLQIDNPEMLINQNIYVSSSIGNLSILLDVPPQLIDSRILVPVRAVAESFDADVVWDDNNQAVIITTKIEDDSLERIKEKGVLTIGSDESFPPLTFKDVGGNFAGFDIDLARAVADELGVELEVKPINWEDKEVALNSHEIDAIWSGLTITSERKEYMLFSEPYLTNQQVFIVKADSPIIAKRNLVGKTIGYISGSLSEYIYMEISDSGSDDFIENTKGSSYQIFTDALSALNKGEADAVLSDEATALFYNKNSDLFKIIDSELDNSIEDLGVGFRIDDIALRNAVQQALDTMQNDGTYKKIYEKWFG